MALNRELSPSGSSIVRSVIVTLGAAILVATGQWLSALVAAVAYGGVNLVSRRWSVVNSEPAAGTSAAMTTASSSSTSSGRGTQTESLQVERRPSAGGGGSKQKNEPKKKGGILGAFSAFADRHPKMKAFFQKVGKDNIGMLAAFVSWSILTSAVPIIVGLVAITSLFLRDPSTQQTVINHLASATQGAFTEKDIRAIVTASTQHAGILGLIGFLGVLWGGSNVGGSISTAFQAIFEVQGRSFIKEKLIDVGMIFVLTALMLVIIAGSAAGAILSGLVAKVPVPALAQGVGILVTFASAVLLFSVIYLVFPNIQPPFRLQNVWKGTLLSAILFTILSQVWGIYASFEHFGKYGTLLASLLILTAWIYFFAMILMLGAEVVAFESIEEAKREGRSVGPEPKPEQSVPQHKVLRDQPTVQ